jgi:NDP-sugar pyrophosphorylase family protein
LESADVQPLVEEGETVHIGAIITVAGPIKDGPGQSVRPSSAVLNHKLSDVPLAYWPLLGKSILDRVVDTLCVSGVQPISVIPENASSHAKVESIARESGSYWSSWESTVSNYLQEGIETLLLVRIGHYAEIDLSDLLRFHRENGSSLTQACTGSNPLDFIAVDTGELRRGDHLRLRLSQLINSRKRYHFRGYSQELKGVNDYRQLVIDSLSGACSIRPVGREVEPGFWLGEGARVDGSSCVVGPTYVGAGVRVRNACTISGYSSIEQQCEVDCGTNVDNCSIFPATYIGMGLNLKNAIVSGSHLFHLQRNVEVEIQDRRLIGTRYAPQRLMNSAKSYLGGKARKLSTTVLSTRSSRLASLLTSRDAGSSIENLGDCQNAPRAGAEQQSPVILGEVE